MRNVVAFVSGILFSIGLVVGGMTQPLKIVAFLDFFGNWDPSLAFVMGGALLVNLVAVRWVRSKETPVVERSFHIPTRNDIDWRLLVGGGLFGVGWGLAGYCPGPALTSIGSLNTPVLAMVGGMIGGVLLYKAFDRYVMQPTDSSTPEAKPQGEVQLTTDG